MQSAMPKFPFALTSSDDIRDIGQAVVLCNNITFTIEGGMSNQVKGKTFAEYLPRNATASKDGEDPRLVWNYQSGEGLAYLRDYNGEPFIVVLNKLFGITQAMSLYDLATRPTVLINGQRKMAGIDVAKIVEVKKLASLEFKVAAILDDDEKSFSEMFSAVKQQEMIAKREQVDADKRARHEDQIRKRAEARAAVMTRNIVFGFTSDDVRRRGTPVVGDEWKMLKDGTPVIVVENYNNGVAGEAIEAFFVEKKAGCGASKKGAALVSSQPRITPEVIVTVLGRKTFLVKGSLKMVDIYSKAADVTKLLHSGLNSGTIVACPKVEQDDDGKDKESEGINSDMFTLYALTEKQVKTLGVQPAFSLEK